MYSNNVQHKRYFNEQRDEKLRYSVANSVESIAPAILIFIFLICLLMYFYDRCT